MLDLVIENGRLVDGTGNPWFFGDVGIKDGTIVEVGRVNQRGFETIDAVGQIVSPGFIDGHCHSDLMVLDDPESEIKLQQGVTTEVVGNCASAGSSRRDTPQIWSCSTPRRSWTRPPTKTPNTSPRESRTSWSTGRGP